MKIIALSSLSHLPLKQGLIRQQVDKAHFQCMDKDVVNVKPTLLWAVFFRHTQVNMSYVPTEELDNMREKHETEMGLFLREQDRQAARTRGDLQVSNCQRCRPAYPTSLVPFMSSVTACHFGEMLLYASTTAEYTTLRKLHEISRLSEPRSVHPPSHVP